MRNFTLIAFTWMGWIFDFFDLILYSFLLIGIQEEFGLSNSEVALIYSFSLAITAVGGVIIGILGDKIGRRNAIMLSVLIFSIGTLFSGLAWSLGSLLLFRLVTGFGIGGEWAAGHTLINESLPGHERGRASAFIQSGAPVGAALASVVGGFVTPYIGWRWSFILASAPSLILVILMYFALPESPQFMIFKAEANDMRDEELEGITGWKYVRVATKRSFSNLWVIRHNLFLGTMLSLFGMLAYWVVFSWTPKYLKTLEFTDNQIGWWMILSQTGAFIGYLSFGWISHRSGNFRRTFSGYAITFGIGIIIFSNTASMGWDRTALFGIFIAGIGTGFFSGYGPLYCRLFPIRVRNTSASWCFNVGRLGAFIAPLLVAWFAHLYGFAMALSFGSVFALLTAIWIFVIPDEKIAYETSYEVFSEPDGSIALQMDSIRNS